jgi:hypothetical protein
MTFLFSLKKGHAGNGEFTFEGMRHVLVNVAMKLRLPTSTGANSQFYEKLSVNITSVRHTFPLFLFLAFINATMTVMPEMKVVLPQLMQNPKIICGNLPKIYSF